MLNDQEFLEKIINGFKQFDNFIDPWYTLIRGLDLKILYSSPGYNRVFHCDESIIGTHAFLVANEKHFIDQQKIDLEQIITNRQTSRSFVIFKYDDKTQPFRLYKSPLINPNTNNVIGIFCSYEKYYFMSLPLQILRSLEIYNFTYENDIEVYKLTPREKEAIFLFLAGFNSTHIAKVLSKIEGTNISKSTIDSLFRNQLLEKFEVYSRKALFEKLITLGFDRYVPGSILPNVELTVVDLTTY